MCSSTVLNIKNYVTELRGTIELLFIPGRGPDYADPSNININDVLGDFSLTLVDVLDTLAIMGNKTEFQKAVKLVVDTVTFDSPNTVQVWALPNFVATLMTQCRKICADFQIDSLELFCELSMKWAKIQIIVIHFLMFF